MTKQPWYQTLFGTENKTKDVAKERLKLVLLHDRNELGPELVEKIKNDIIEVLSKYVEIDRMGMDVELTRADAMGEDMSAVVANIPIISVKDGTMSR